MRRIYLALVTVSALLLQTAGAPRLDAWEARPDFLLLAVVFIALHGPATEVLVTSWLIGLAASLTSIERPGLLPGTYVLGAALVLGAREYLFRFRMTTQVVVVVLVGFIVRTLWMTHAHLTYSMPNSWTTDLAWVAGWGSLYTSLLAPMMFRFLRPLAPVLGVSMPRYSHAGLHRLV